MANIYYMKNNNEHVIETTSSKPTPGSLFNGIRCSNLLSAHDAGTNYYALCIDPHTSNSNFSEAKEAFPKGIISDLRFYKDGDKAVLKKPGIQFNTSNFTHLSTSSDIHTQSSDLYRFDLGDPGNGSAHSRTYLMTYIDNANNKVSGIDGFRINNEYYNSPTSISSLNIPTNYYGKVHWQIGDFNGNHFSLVREMRCRNIVTRSKLTVFARYFYTDTMTWGDWIRIWGEFSIEGNYDGRSDDGSQLFSITDNRVSRYQIVASFHTQHDTGWWNNGTVWSRLRLRTLPRNL